MSNITAFRSSKNYPNSELNILFESLSKKDYITSEMATTLEQLNTLEHSGLIPSKEAILIKNNLNDELFAEGILSDLILKLVKKGKLAPEMRNIVYERRLKGSILFLYTCHLEQTYSTLKPYIIQQQLWKCSPKKLLLKMVEAQEMESKKYVNDWIFSLKFLNQEIQTSLEPLLHPLTNTQFKSLFLSFVETLSRVEKDFTHQICLQELYELLKKTPDTEFFQVTSSVLKASLFYQTHIQKIEKNSYSDHQFSLCLAADAIKNAPYSKKLPMYYNLIYGHIKNKWDLVQNNLLKKSITILVGCSEDEKNVANTIQKSFEKANQPFSKIELSSLNNNIKSLIQPLIKNSPASLIGAVDPEHQDLLLETAKSLELPITFFPPYTEASKWEETSNNSYPYFRIAFPTPLSSDISEEINGEKTKISGIPGVFQNTKTQQELKLMWGFSAETKVVLVNTPEGDSPWPSFLSKEYKTSKNITLAVLTEKKNKSFIHNLKTKISPSTDLPIKIYSSLTPLEREELFTLADLVIDKGRTYSSLLFETSHAKTPLLIDNCPPDWFSGGLFACLSRIPSLFYRKKEAPLLEIHEKILNDQNLGIMIRSKANFKLAFEELLFQENPISPPTLLEKTFPNFVREMKLDSQEQNKTKPAMPPLHFFTSV